MKSLCLLFIWSSTQFYLPRAQRTVPVWSKAIHDSHWSHICNVQPSCSWGMIFPTMLARLILNTYSFQAHYMPYQMKFMTSFGRKLPKFMMCTFPGFVSDRLALSPQRPQHSVGFLCGPQRPLVIFEVILCCTIISVYLIKREEKLILWSILRVVVCCFDLADNHETKLSGNEWNVYIGKG